MSSTAAELPASLDISLGELREILARAIGRPAMPCLGDEAVRMRAMAIARRQGLLATIDAELKHTERPPIIPHSLYGEYRLKGNRSHYEAALGFRLRQIDLAAMACYLGLDRLTYLQDLLWAQCEATSWVLPAHARNSPVDLAAAMQASHFATISRLLEHQLEPEVRQRVHEEIRRRVWDIFLDRPQDLWWIGNDANWNAVCCAGVAISAMLLETDVDRLAAILHRVIQSSRPFLLGFTDDGGCTEGPAYWRYGFGWYVHLARALYDFTAGEIDLLAGQRVRRITQYGLAVHLAPGLDLPFADSVPQTLSPMVADALSCHLGMSELWALCRLREDGTAHIHSLEDLLFCDNQAHAEWKPAGDDYLADLGIAALRHNGLTLGAKAGHNGEHHNHNDVGSFVVHRGRTFFLTDLGAPVYSQKVFGPNRYNTIFCGSHGHSVPIINGQLQKTGRQFAGTLRATGLNGPGCRTLEIDATAAYGLAELQQFVRALTLDPASSAVRLRDTFSLTVTPAEIVETFMTTQPVERVGEMVIIHSESDGLLELRCTTAGQWKIEELPEESRDARAEILIRRITFVPDRLDSQMCLEFDIAPARVNPA
jgi:hypothetical protein